VFLDHPELEHKQLPVRYDPYDAGHAFVSLPGHRQPVECLCEYHAQLKGRSQRELQIATEELRERHHRHSQQLTVTAAKLARFITSVEAQEALLDQRKRDEEARAVFALMEGTPRHCGEDELRQKGAAVSAGPQGLPAAIFSIHSGAEAESSTLDDDLYEDF